MNKSLSYHHYYQVVAPVRSTKFRSKSSDTISNNNERKIECQEKEDNKKCKVKKSQTSLIDFQTKPIQTTFSPTSVLRRRFSLFRTKRSQQSDEYSNSYTLQQNIDQLKYDLQIKTNELEEMKEYIENKRKTMIQSSNESIEQAMQIQIMLNEKLEDMLLENDFLKKNIQELEFYAQQQIGKDFFCKFSLTFYNRKVD
ncbi:unnamed protein product [Adineta steineri]|uniref:Uncharacterized protein n=1 Tax=Adineta steineri TaxID=433720 RepID=A0A815F6G7_9BILA|nr:unnamed protein product [Adineta steineri]CAF1320982.1 unnamed protein product [Adineta steineri]CAF1545709.1 unnamed protein product [Adineta steineri]